MKVFLLLVLSASTFAMLSCEKGNPYKDLSGEELGKKASEKFEAILQLANPTSCTDPAEWMIADIQSVCGPAHIAYHETVDQKKLQSLIKDYNLLVEIYAPMVAPSIDCMPYREPIGVSCVEGEAKVEYESNRP